MAETTIFQDVQLSPMRWGIRKGRWDRWDEKNIKKTTHPFCTCRKHSRPALPYAKEVGRPGTGSYPSPSPEPNTHDVPLYLTLFWAKLSCSRQLNQPPIILKVCKNVHFIYTNQVFWEVVFTNCSNTCSISHHNLDFVSSSSTISSFQV